MIKCIVLKSFRDINNNKTYIKESIYVSSDLSRIKNLEKLGFIKIIHISNDMLTLKELKEKYPKIKAKSKKEFLLKI
jgi:hypothetical protein